MHTRVTRPERRFFGNAKGHQAYSESVLDVGVEEAVRQIDWSPESFNNRGGSYDWRRKEKEVRP